MFRRRSFLKALALASGVLAWPKILLSAWNAPLFRAESLDDALRALQQDIELEPSTDITLHAPEIAENGAIVPIRVETELAHVKRISILVEKNPTPAAASFDISDAIEPKIALRIRMSETSKVLAVVETADRTHVAIKSVKVTIGGCGG